MMIVVIDKQKVVSKICLSITTFQNSMFFEINIHVNHFRMDGGGHKLVHNKFWTSSEQVHVLVHVLVHRLVHFDLLN